MNTEDLPPDYSDHPDPPRRNRKRILAWIAVGLFALILILVIGITALLHNKDFKRYILRVAETRLSEAAGIPLRMNDFSVHLSGLSPSVDMYGIVIEGAPPYQTPPVLQADHLKVGVQIVSLLSRKWYLKEVAIDHPVARVRVSENGDTNLPKLKSSGPSPSIFDIGVRHVTLGQGEVYYNDRKSELDADLHDLEFQSSFDTGLKRYSGGLSYKDGRIHFRNLNPMVHSLEAEFEATTDTFTLKHGKITSGASEVSLSATMNGYVHPKITATYQSSLDTVELGKILKEPTLPSGIVKIAGSGRFENDPNKPAIQTITADGNVTINALQVHTPSVHTQVRDLSARYTLQNGDAEIRDLRAKVLGGSVEGRLRMRDVTGAQLAELHAAVNNIALASLRSLVNAPVSKDLMLSGTANASIDANWRKTLDTLTAHTDAELKGSIAKTDSPVLNADGSVHLTYSAAKQEVSFDHSYIRLPETTVHLNGAVSKTASLQLQVQSNDLREVETAAGVFGAMPQPLGLEGSATFSGTVRGSTVNPQIDGQLSAASLKVKGTAWRTLHTGIDADPSHVALHNGEIIPASNRGRMTFNLDVGLDQWTFRDTSPFRIDANATQLNIADLKNLAGVQAPVTGTLAANISLHGSELNPVGGGTITLTQALVSDEPIQSATIDFQGTGDEIRARLGFRMPAGSAQANVTYFPKRKAYDGQLQTAGFHLDQLHTLRAHNINLTGTLNLSAKGSGTLDNPGVQFTAQIPQLQIENERINGITLQAEVANHVADVNLDSESASLKTFVRGHGRVNLTGSYQTDAMIDTASIPLQPLFAIYLPAQAGNLSGETELHATIHGPLKDKTQIEAHITIPTLTLAFSNQVQLAAAAPIRMDYSRAVFNLQRTSIRGTGTDLQLQGTVPINSAAPMTIVALGKVDLSLIQMLDPDVTTSGQVQFNIDGTGKRSSPDVQGQVTIVNASVAGDSLPVGLQNGNGVLVLTNDRLDIRQFSASVSGGTFTATGGLAYRPAIQFNVALNAKNIRTLYPEGVREGLEANLSLAGTPNYATLRGQVRLTDVSFTPSFDLNNIIGALGSAPGIATPPGDLAHNLHLDISVVSTNDVNLTNSKLSIQGAANLRLSGTAAQPAVLGRVNLTGGDFIFRANRYILQPSTLDFVDPYQISPRVNLAVDTTIQQYDIHMLLRGTMDRLRTTYTSEPSLPPSDIINLLVFGKTSEAQNANSTPGNLGAESMIASSVSGQVTNRVEKVAGISQLSVDPVLGGTVGENPGARVTVQQRVTGNMFVTFASDATSTQTQVIKLEYQATPKVSLSGVRDQNGGFAFDIRIRKTW